jgi:hypothetical protein
VTLVVSLKEKGRANNKAYLATYFRLALRETCGSPKTNERSLMCAVIPPYHLCAHQLLVEQSPDKRPNSQMLFSLAILNTFTIDSRVRPMVQATISKSILEQVDLPDFESAVQIFLGHAALRLVTNHVGFIPLWQEQLGDEWRESEPVGMYPVLAGDDARWKVRSAIDAVVAQAYGLSREQYAHVLSTFSHKSYPKAPSLCLAKFDELMSIGVEAFVRKYDPYWDVPLVESLPSPVIELPKLGGESALYDAKDMFGNPLSTDLFGNVVSGKKNKRTKR